MLNSLLERLFKKIKVNRIIKISNDEKILLTEEKKVLNKIRSYFMKQFHKRNINQKKLSARWVKAYSIIENINSEIYKNLLVKVTEKE